MPKFEIVTIDEAKKAIAEGERSRRQISRNGKTAS
jgi:hypothetical protein